MRLHWHKWIRKAHRYLGLLIGLQFLAWTAGGLYFSWTEIDTVHGTDRLGPAPQLNGSLQTASLAAIEASAMAEGLCPIGRVELLVTSPDSAVYRVTGRDSAAASATRLFDALTADPRGPLTQEEALRLAQLRYSGTAEVVATRLLEASGPHGEYRELPLPAYAFTFGDGRRTTIYVAPEHARVTSVRNDHWRVFDFLWMLHTMDYAGRDNFNNRLLQVFAVFGLLTLLSGFALFAVSSKLFRHALPLHSRQR